MKNLMLFFGAILCYSGVYCQESGVSLGPRVGVNFADVSNVDNSETRVGLALGATATISFNEMSGLTIDLLYSQEGYEVNGSKIDLSYLQIPVFYDVFFGNLGDKVRPKVYVGFAPGFLLNAEADDMDISDTTKDFVFSVAGGGGVNVRLADRVWLNTDLRAFLGLTDIREDQQGDTVSPRNVQLSVGVAFGLSKIR